MKMTSKRMMSLGLVALIITGIPITLAGLSRIWSREFTENQFTFHYTLPPEIYAFVCNNLDQYQTKTEVVELRDGSTWFTIVEETYTDPWNEILLMDFILTTEAVGAELIAVGQYLTFKTENSEVVITLVDAPFNIPTDQPFTLEINEASNRYQWRDPAIDMGWALQLTFSIDSSNIIEAETGDYTYSYDISLGVNIDVPE